MDSKQLVEEFQRTWSYTRKMTDQFIDCVPQDKLFFSHHAKFGSLLKQFRHIVGVYGCYIDAFKTRKMDLSKKKLKYSNLMSRLEIQNALQKYDTELTAILESLKSADLSNFKVNFFGQEMGFTEYTHVLIQHECAHFGIWANYAAFGEFETPEIWQSDWKL